MKRKNVGSSSFLLYNINENLIYTRNEEEDNTMVIDKLSKKLVYPIRHRWTVKDKQLQQTIKEKTFGIGLTRPSQRFTGYQLSKITTNNIVIDIINLSNNSVLRTVKGTVDDINKAFVHAFNNSYDIDKQLNKESKKTLVKRLILKPMLTDNQIYLLLLKNKYKQAMLFDGLSNDDIEQCRIKANQFNKLLNISPSQYKFDTNVQTGLHLDKFDCVLVANSYANRSDNFQSDKHLFNDSRYSSTNRLIQSIIECRFANRQVIPIKFIDNNPNVVGYDDKTKLPIRIVNNNHFVTRDVSYIDWNIDLCGCTVKFNNDFEIIIDKSKVIIKHDNRSVQRSLNALESVLTKGSISSWPITLKDDTTVITTFLNALKTNHRYNGNTKTISSFETVYQELTEQQQIDSVLVFKIVDKLFATLRVDNPSILLYYLFNQESSKLLIKHIRI